MKKIIIGLLASASVAVAQLPPPPASQADVDAGVNSYKYVSPKALANKAGGSGAGTFNPNQFSVGNGSTNIPGGALVTNLVEYTGHDLRTGSYSGNGSGLSNVVVLNLTNATSSNIAIPTMADKFVAFSTNGVIAFTGINVAAVAGVQYWRGAITNTLGSVATYTFASPFLGVSGGTAFNTNLATITIEYWPGLFTNVMFQCIR